MNWKENAHLFCNGKFKIEWEHDKFSPSVIDNIVGITHNGLLTDYDDTIDCKLDDCTLIARRISDMTDKECSVIEWDDNLKFHYSDYANSLRLQDALYLLSIGVYPFDQSHFKTGEVLDAKEVSA